MPVPRCSSHSIGIVRVKFSSCIPFRCRPIEDRLNDVGRQQSEPHHAVDEAARDTFSISYLSRRTVGPVFNQALPPMRPRQRADQRLVGPWLSPNFARDLS